ncbi:hypothetical protein EZS27_007179 [termite gut metagenome]|uniref:Uncharacterized protein n=1 Tax=termite gut metagenome TaxID=433724 RepID=A0A5J4SGE1_9ZZZZ
MENKVENLWPKIMIDSFNLPKAILSKQADYLGESTKNIVTAKIESYASPNDSEGKSNTKHRFIVYAPTLNYQFELLSVEHDTFASYPLLLTCSILEKKYYPETEKGFIERLSQIFNEPKVQNAIKTLIAQSQ